MNYLTLLMFDVSNIDMWKLKISSYLKALRLHIYFSTTEKISIENFKYLEANV